jgi:trans-L-3-hydroxyproline dehydratase
MIRLTCDDLHTAGEPVRIVTGGYPDLPGETILDRRRAARERFDHLRRALMWEPRGHAGMYGVIPVRAAHPEAAFGVLFTHHEGYSTMCGHATIALARWAVDTGRVPAEEPVTRFAIEAPCGLLRVSVDVRDGKAGRARFESVPAFVLARDLAVSVSGRRVVADIAYGGAFYAILPASRLGLDLSATPLPELVAAAGNLTDAIRAGTPISHPDAADLGFLYGTILTDEATPDQESANLCVFAERQVDRSPTGSGVTARVALDVLTGRSGIDLERRFRSLTGGVFTGKALAEANVGPHPALTVEVGGEAFWMGQSTFLIDPEDPLGEGFALAGSGGF